MNKVEVKNKLRKVIIRMLGDFKTEEIPDAIANNILKNYGCTVADDSCSEDDLDLFLKNLHIYVETTHCLSDDSTVAQSKFDLELYDNYLQASTEYCEVTQELAKLLEEVIIHKETHSGFFKHECITLNTSAQVLNKKCQFLKLQCLLKLYGEDNSLRGHLALRNLLKEELLVVRDQYSKAVEANNYVKKMKNFGKLSELFKFYKELKNTETAAKMLAESI